MTSPLHDRLGRVGESAQRVVRAVDGLADEAWREPSLLPAWTRAHVVAHLALNGEALGRVLRSIVADGPRQPMYDSDEQRSSDIEELAAAEPTVLRERLLGATTTFAEAAASLPDDRWDERVERTPGGRELTCGAIPGMRWGELEIHHADLGIGYTPDDWALDFAEHELRAMTSRVDPPAPFEVRPTDTDQVFVFGTGGGDDVTIVTGPTAQLAWWLTGRPPGEGISASRGDLPSIGRW
jgi:maleylpyruvate isomerase